MTTKSAAILTVYNAPGMTKHRRLAIAEWLRAKALCLLHREISARERFLATRTLLTLRAPTKYSAKGRRDIAAWLRMHAKYLEQHGTNYSKRFTARYLYA